MALSAEGSEQAGGPDPEQGEGTPIQGIGQMPSLTSPQHALSLHAQV